jgi:hypothetical protein
MRNIEKNIVAIINSKAEENKEEKIINILTDFSLDNGERTLAVWWSLFESMMVKYHDGFRTDNVHVDQIAPTPVFYPFYWLITADYWKDNKPDFSITSWQYAKHPATIPPEQRHPLSQNIYADMMIDSSSSSISIAFWFVISSCICMIMGIYIGMKLQKSKQEQQYNPIQQYDA